MNGAKKAPTGLFGGHFAVSAGTFETTRAIQNDQARTDTKPSPRCQLRTWMKRSNVAWSSTNWPDALTSCVVTCMLANWSQVTTAISGTTMTASGHVGR